MLNERREIDELLNGQIFNKKNLYRSCWLLAKHFKEEGYDQYDTVGQIYKWGSRNDLKLHDNQVSIANKVYRDNLEIQEEEVKIYKTDIDQINKYANYYPGYQSSKKNYNMRLVLFAILAYHRTFKNANDECRISMIGISSWTNIHEQHLHNRYLNKIYESNFIEKVKEDEFMHLKSLRRKNKIKSKVNKFVLNIDNPNEDDEFIIFKDNDLRLEFDLINEHFY
jgi:hypothetical protein